MRESSTPRAAAVEAAPIWKLWPENFEAILQYAMFGPVHSKEDSDMSKLFLIN